jgi:16S rRNA (cytidine1402-2'-O)-methyltransferase
MIPVKDAYPSGLYIVATPIGNLSDVSDRAKDVLRAADVIAVEDSRVTATLLRHVGAKVPMVRYDDHVGDAVRPQLLDRMANEVVVLVSDAGTPLISDPGYKLVRDARERGLMVTTVPGPCAAVAALTLAGLPTNRFLFMGFLPPKAKARADTLAEIATVRATLVFYESGPRLVAALQAMAEVLGDREAAVAREITKKFEECRTGPLMALAAHYDAHPAKGEIVIVVGPPSDADIVQSLDLEALLRQAMTDFPAAKAVRMVAKDTGADKDALTVLAEAIRHGA